MKTAFPNSWINSGADEGSVAIQSGTQEVITRRSITPALAISPVDTVR